METIRRVRDLLSRKEKLRLLSLIPTTLLASMAELVIVAAAAGFFTLISDTATLNEPTALGDAYRASGLTEGGFLVLVGVGVLTAVITGNAMAALANRRVYTFAWSQVANIGERVLGAYLRQPYEFFLVRSAPELSQRLLVETQSVVSRVIVAGTLLGARLFGAALIIGWLIWREPLLTLLLVFVLGTGYGGMFALLRRRLRANGKRVSEANKARHRVALETLAGVKELQLYGLHQAALSRFREPSDRFANARAYQEQLTNFTKYALESVAIGGLVAVVVLFLATGRDTTTILPVLATFAIAAFRLLPTFQLFFDTLAHIQMESYALGRIHEDVMSAPKAAKLAREADAPPFERSLALAGVRYQYPQGHEPVLDGLNVELSRGSWTALVGSTGSGKSTLVDLLMGLLKPGEGEILLDGRPLRSRAELAAWQQRVGYVPQTMFVSDTTIAQNIALGDAEPDLSRVSEAARLAAVAEFVEQELPERYQTRVGDRGVRLSGGQRQRMGIARALYREPELLVLDEATSALDNRTEAAVIAALRERFARTTVVMVAHRLTTTRHCDQILVLERGRIVDRGSYAELMARSDRFREMVQAGEGTPFGDPEPPPARASSGLAESA